MLGIFRKIHEGGRLEPTDRRVKSEFRISLAHAKGAEDGEIVLCEVLAGRRLGLPEARVVERIGDSNHPRAVSLIAITDHGIPVEFPQAAVAEAEAARPVGVEGRTDLRQMPLVTIDGADARDFDDAVFAEPHPEREGFWHAVVAIADVAWYVRPGSDLDRSAQRRGNSAYFPDRVVPMLPEALSNELLLPQAQRGARLPRRAHDHRRRGEAHRAPLRARIDALGRSAHLRAGPGGPGRAARRHHRPAPRSRDPPALPASSELLDRARQKRGALELDLPERKVVAGRGRQGARASSRAPASTATS